MVTRAVGGVVALVLAGSPAWARQEPSPEVRPPDRAELRHQVYVMEGALARAVQFGAQRLNRELRTVAPDMFLLAGEAQARGVYLEGYGIFFDVEVPMLRESMMWSLRTMLERDDARVKSDIASLRRWLQGVQDPTARVALEQSLKRLESQAMPVNVPQANMPPAADAGVNPALTVAGAAAAPASAPGAAPPNPPPPPPVDWALLQDPNRAYSESVIRALIDAMIDFSAPMAIRAEEWLTVGARDNGRRDSLAPQDPYEEVVTVLLRIKGSDLQEYRAGRIDKAEARKRVRVGEF